MKVGGLPFEKLHDPVTLEQWVGGGALREAKPFLLQTKMDTGRAGHQQQGY